jgi:hypothetical protein
MKIPRLFKSDYDSILAPLQLAKGVRMDPGYYWGRPGIGTSSGVLTNNRLYFAPIQVGKVGPISSVIFDVKMINVGGPVHVGIFRLNKHRGADLLKDLGTITVTTTGAKTLACSYSIPSPGLYLIGFRFEYATTNGLTIGAEALSGTRRSECPTMWSWPTIDALLSDTQQRTSFIATTENLTTNLQEMGPFSNTYPYLKVTNINYQIVLVA